MRTFTAGHDMRFRPTSAELIEGNTETLTFKLANPVGSSSITGTPTLTCTGLTFASTSISGTTLTTKVSGGEADKVYTVELSMVTADGQTRIGTIDLEWKAAGFNSRTGIPA